MNKSIKHIALVIAFTGIVSACEKEKAEQRFCWDCFIADSYTNRTRSDYNQVIRDTIERCDVTAEEIRDAEDQRTYTSSGKGPEGTTADVQFSMTCRQK